MYKDFFKFTCKLDVKYPNFGTTKQGIRQRSLYTEWFS